MFSGIIKHTGKISKIYKINNNCIIEIISNIKFSNNFETKETEMRPNFLARPASSTSNFYPLSEPNLASPLPSAPSGAPPLHLCAAGRGGSKASDRNPQAES